MYFVPDDTQICGYYECKEDAKLLKVIEGEDVEKMDGLLSLARTGGDFSWI